jgi:hypothetical protein
MIQENHVATILRRALAPQSPDAVSFVGEFSSIQSMRGSF